MALQVSPNTFFGLEIEICIDDDTYKKLGYRDDHDEDYKTENSSSSWQLPPASGQNKADVEVRNIVLSEDITCKCPRTMKPAEIISPKTNTKTFPYYEQFLLSKVFHNMSALHQGETCGIHVHWSNSSIIPQSYYQYDAFNFLLVYNLFRMSRIFHPFMKEPEFSGRVHFYSEPNALTLEVQHFSTELIWIQQPEVPLFSKISRVCTLSSALKALDHYYEKGLFSWHGLTIEKFVEELLPLLHIENMVQFEGALGEALLMYTDTQSPVQFLSKRENIIDIKEEHLFQGSKDKKVQQFIELYTKFVYHVVPEIEDIIDFNENTGVIEQVRNVYNEAFRSQINYVPDFYDILVNPEVDLTSALIQSNYKKSLNIIDLEDNHLEFRIFSLDTLFGAGSVGAGVDPGSGPTSTQVLSELRRYITNTERFISQIQYEVMAAYKATKGDLKKLRANERYVKFFLYDKFANKQSIAERYADFGFM